MHYLGLKEFISKRMRMSHIYQPVMLMALLRNDGRCSVTQIAKAILKYDNAQIEYYEQITNNMVGKVLRNRGIVEKQGKNYILKDLNRLGAAQRGELINLCQLRLSEYLDKRGEKIFAYRKLRVDDKPRTPAVDAEEDRGGSERQAAYRELFFAHLDREALNDIRLALNRGQPVGNARFLARIEQMTGIRREAKPRGRPRVGAKPGESTQPGKHAIAI